MTKGKKVSRRQFIRVSALTVAGIVVASCAEPEVSEEELIEGIVEEEPTEAEPAEAEPTEAEPTEGEPTSKYSEAPMLATLVEAGELPPVDERLPVEPYMVEPTRYLDWEGDAKGKYGGVWRMATKGAGDGALWHRTVLSGGHIVEWDTDFSMGGTRKAIAKAWEVSEDGRSFTFHLRKGHKWSDGEPFTTEDVEFWYEHQAMNEDLTPVIASNFRNGDEPAELEIKDDQTFTFTFKLPNGFFLWDLAKPGGDEFLVPKHYMKQFHPDFVDEAELESKVSDAGYDDWMQLYDDRNSAWDFANPERPGLWPWMLTVGVGEGPQVVFERNPYCYMVDQEGKQVPYIDKVRGNVHEDTETMVLDAISGEIDMQSRFITGQFATHDGVAMVMENREKGDYQLVDQCNLPGPSGRTIPFNLTIEDEVLREIFRDTDFRKAMSHAIDREELWDVISRGLAEFDGPESASPLQVDEADEIWEELAVYDPDRANELLDGMGLDEKDGDDFRLRPDGERLVVTIETVADWEDAVGELEMVADYWEAVGVDARLKTFDRTVFQDRREANECQVACHGSSVGGGVGFPVSTLVDFRMQAPVNWESDWGPLWWQWYDTDGEQGEEPPEDVKRACEIFDEIKTTPDIDKQVELAKEPVLMRAQNVWQIWTGPVWLPRCEHCLVKNNMQNVPPEFPWSWWYPSPAPTQTYLYYFDPPQEL